MLGILQHTYNKSTKRSGEKKWNRKKIFKEKLSGNSPRFIENLLSIQAKMNSKQDKYKKIHAQVHHSKSCENQEKENLESSKRKTTHYMQLNFT